MFFFFPESITEFYRVLLTFANEDLAFKKDILRVIFSEISQETNAIVSSSQHFFLLNIAHHLVDLNTPFWIEIKVN